jgi:hypothetical protein
MLKLKNIDMKKNEKKMIKETVPVPDHIEKKLKGAKESFENLSPKKKKKK